MKMHTDLHAIAEASAKQRAGRWPFADLTPKQRREIEQLLEAKRDGKLARWPDGIRTHHERSD